MKLNIEIEWEGANAIPQYKEIIAALHTEGTKSISYKKHEIKNIRN